MGQILSTTTTGRLPAKTKAGYELAKLQSSLISAAGIPIRHNIHSVGGHNHNIIDLALTPDGKRFVSGSYDNTARLWEMDGGHCLMVYRGHYDDVCSVAISTDGKLLATGSKDKSARIWDVETGTCRHHLTGHTERVLSIAFSPDGRRLFTAGEDGRIVAWSVLDGNRIMEFSARGGAVRRILLARGGSVLYSCGGDGVIRLWDCHHGVKLKEFPVSGEELLTCCLSPDETLLYAAGKDKIIRSLEADSGRIVREYSGHKKAVSHVTLDRKGARLLSTSEDGTIRVWNLLTAQSSFVHGGTMDGTVQVRFSTTDPGRFIVAEAKRGRVVDVATGNCREILIGPEKGNLASFCLSPDETWAAGGDWDGTIYLWNVPDSASRHRLTPPCQPEESIHTMAISSDNQYLVTGNDKGYITLWDLHTGEPLAWFKGHPDRIMDCRITRDKRYIVTCGRGFDDNIRVWDVAAVLATDQKGLARFDDTGSFQGIFTWDGYRMGLRGHDDSVFVLDINEDETLLASGCADKSVKVWDLQRCLKAAENGFSKQCSTWLQSFPNHDFYVSAVRFSRDSQWLVSGSYDSKVRIFDLEKKELIATFSGLRHEVSDIDISADKQRVIAGGWDNRLIQWDTATGKVVGVYIGNDDVYPERGIFNQDGTAFLVSGSNAIHQWAADRHELLQTYSGSISNINSLEIGPHEVILGDYLTTIKRIQLQDCAIKSAFQIGVTYISSLSLSHSGRQLAVGSGTIARIVDDETQKAFRWYRHRENVTKIRLNAATDRLYTAAKNGCAYLYENESWNCRVTYRGHEKSVTDLILTRDETVLFTASEDGTIRRWEPESGVCLNVFRGHNDSVMALALNWNETLLFSGSRDGTIKIWENNGGTTIRTIETGYPVDRLVITSDGGTIVAGGNDGSLKIWDGHSGRLLRELDGHEKGRRITGLGLDKQDKMVISSGLDGTVRFWDLATGELLVTFHNLREGFLWTTPPDAVAPQGWFWTDRPELINILECDEDGGNPHALEANDPRRLDYLAIYNNKKMVVNRLQQNAQYRKELAGMVKGAAQLQAKSQPVLLISEQRCDR